MSQQDEADDQLEDSIIGNDLLLDKCRFKGKRLRNVLGPVVAGNR